MNLYALIAGLVGLIVSAHTKYHGVPALWLVAASVVLILLGAVLWLARQLLQEGLRLRPRTVTA